ncbi:hypothetical protein BD779DRAFT_1519209 [Infundibulicybe gibba]|nr:hypothetical protein BD779DRAFT_1519209 [Infundibulicybe gibba]
MIWRCWVVWFSVGQHAAYLVISLPLVMLFAALATGTLFLFTLAHPTSYLGGHTSLAPAHISSYTSLITMTIESAALYSIVGLACLITYGVGSPVNTPFVSASISAQQISGYLLIARLAHRQTWQKDPSTHSRVEVNLKFKAATASDSQLSSSR